MIVFGLMASYQVAVGLWFCWKLWRSGVGYPADIQWPKTAILMSLRGADSQLNSSLKRILEQDYPDFTLHVVVDNANDPAYSVVQNAAKAYGEKLVLSLLTDRKTTCGLQCSAFLQASKGIAADAKVLVTVDGDLMPHPTWLKELNYPFIDPKVGATFGDRWFTPNSPSYGGLVRYLWNSAAVVPMALFSIPWGGCFAIRRLAFDQTGLANKWSQAIVHDAPAMECLQELGLKIQFVPNLMMPIRENCSLAFCLDFIKRQMTWTRIYHSGWGHILIHAFATSGLWLIAILQIIMSAYAQDWNTVAVVGGSLIGYSALLLSVAGLLEVSVRKTLVRRKESTRWITFFTLMKLPVAFFLAQPIHFVAVLYANSIRQVTWRGVTYLLRGPWDILLKSDQPFEQTSNDSSL